MGNMPAKWAADRAAEQAEKHLRPYFKGLSSSQMRLGCAGGGVIELGPLELRPEAFLHSDSPLEIKAGYVGKLHIRLPNLHELTTGPFTVRVQGVYILLGLAARHAWWNEAAEQRSKRARHQAAIAAAEQLLHSLQSGADAEEPSSNRLKGLDSFFKQTSFAMRKLLQAFTNFRLDVQDVCVVLDEDQLLPTQPFALCLTISAIEIASPASAQQAAKPQAGGDASAAASEGKPVRPASGAAAAEGGRSKGEPPAGAAADPGAEVIRKTASIRGMSIRIIPRDSAIPAEFVAVAST